jgi:predicted hydrolase (HD superfamily)
MSNGTGTNFDRAQAWQLLTEWTQGESLRKHALAVEACVAACGEGRLAGWG